MFLKFINDLVIEIVRFDKNVTLKKEEREDDEEDEKERKRNFFNDAKDKMSLSFNC